MRSLTHMGACVSRHIALEGFDQDNPAREIGSICCQRPSSKTVSIVCTGILEYFVILLLQYVNIHVHIYIYICAALCL